MPFFAWLMFRLTSHWKQFRISGSSRIGNDLPVQAHPALDNSAVRLHDLEQFQHYGGHAAEMTRPEAPFHMVRYAPHFHEGDLRLRIHLLHQRREYYIHAPCRAKCQVRFQRPRISSVVLALVELNRVDEDAQRHRGGCRARFVNEPAMTCVQRAHGRHETERTPRLREPATEVRDRVDDAQTYFTPALARPPDPSRHAGSLPEIGPSARHRHTLWRRPRSARPNPRSASRTMARRLARVPACRS